MTEAILLVIALDTKGAEARFLRTALEQAGHPVLLLDFGTGEGSPADISNAEVAAAAGGSLEALRAAGQRADAIDLMQRGAASVAARLYRQGRVAGVLSIGGSGGTSVGTAAMRALPFGVPKVMVSTVASGDVKPFVDIADITMMNAVADFGGLNTISETVLRAAAGAISGMVLARKAAPTRTGNEMPLVAATMFGVTTAVVEACRSRLAKLGYALVPFHATGVGGRTMEQLIDSGFFVGVLDLTTTEWADEVVGGTLSAGPDRLGAGARFGLPQVIAPGALDMVNFWGSGGVPEQFSDRLIHRHSENSYLMRTTPAENTEIGRRMAEKLNQAIAPVTILFPTGGVSALDRPGQPFWDPEADQALLDSFKACAAPHVRVEALDTNINDERFADRAVAELLRQFSQPRTAAYA